MASLLLGMFRPLRRRIAQEVLAPVFVSYWRRLLRRLQFRRRHDGIHRQEESSPRRESLDSQFRVRTARSLLDYAALSEVRNANWRHSLGYEPSEPGSFDRLLGALPIACEDYTFTDFGFGKSRAFLLAANYPSWKIIGVEYCPPERRPAMEGTGA